MNIEIKARCEKCGKEIIMQTDNIHCTIINIMEVDRKLYNIYNRYICGSCFRKLNKIIDSNNAALESFWNDSKEDPVKEKEE